MPDEQEGTFSPEELESGEQAEKIEAEGGGEAEADPEPEPKHRRGISDERFEQVLEDSKEAKHRLRAMEDEARQLRLHILNMQSQQVAASKPKEPDVDPEVESIVSPVLMKRMKPLLDRLEYLEQKTGNMEVKSVGDAAFQYVVNNVPDLSEISGDLMAYIEARRDKDQILADPNRVVDCAEIVRFRRNAGKSMATDEAKRDSRSRARTETGSIVQRSETRDWSKDPEALAREMERQGF